MRLRKRMGLVLTVTLMLTSLSVFATESVSNNEAREISRVINTVTTPAVITLMPNYMECIPNVGLMPAGYELRDKMTDTVIIDENKNIYDLNGKKVVDGSKAIYSPYTGQKLIDGEGYILNDAGQRIIAPDGEVDKTKVDIKQEDKMIIVYDKYKKGRAYFKESLEITGEAERKSWYILDSSDNTFVIAKLKNQSGEFYTVINMGKAWLNRLGQSSIYTYEGNTDWIFWTENNDFKYEGEKYLYLKKVSASSSGDSGSSSSKVSSSNNDSNKAPTEEAVQESVVGEPKQGVNAKESKETIKDISVVAQSVVKENERELTNQAVVAKGIKMVINGQTIDLQSDVLIDNSRTMLPIRELGEMLNLQVGYNSESKVAIIVKDGKRLEFPIGYNVAIINGKDIVKIDENNPKVKVIVSKSKTYLPLRFIAEQLELKINFKDKTISIEK